MPEFDKAVPTAGTGTLLQCGYRLQHLALNSPTAKHSRTIGDSIACGDSILQIAQLATAGECQVLLNEASTISARENGFSATDPARALWSVPEAKGRMRLPIDKALSDDSQALCDSLLSRAVEVLRESMPELVRRLFGSRLDEPMVSLRHNARVAFSPREPAINIYTSRGRFKPHKDHETLTVIVPLNASFEGGGTAFWSADNDDVKEPSLLLIPPPGTAIVFAGNEVVHAAVEVTAGERFVLVASFSPCGSDC